MKRPIKYSYGEERLFPPKPQRKKTPEKSEQAKKEDKKNEESPAKKGGIPRKCRRNTRSSAKDEGGQK